MKFKIKDKIKYFFPNPGISNKQFVTGEISFIGETGIILICEDKSTLKISHKNFDRIMPFELQSEKNT